MKPLLSKLFCSLLPLAAASVAAASAGTPDPSLAAFHWADVDGDGLRDVFVMHPQGANRLFLNRGDGRFDDATARLGLDGLGAVRAALWRDHDADGRADLLVIGDHGAARLLERSGGPRFVDATALRGLDLSEGVLAASWIDFDADGLADLAVSGPSRDRLWHNLGATFVEVSLDLPPALEPPVYGAPSPEGSGTPESPPLNPGGGGPGYTVSAGPSMPLGLPCLPQITDQAGGCLEASSAPQLGRLYPLSTDLNVTSTGRVGVGTTNPYDKLGVAGGVSASGLIAGYQFRSTATTGSPPVIVASTTTCPKLSADMLDGLDSTDFSQLGSSIEGIEISDGTISGADVADNTLGDQHIRATAPIQGTKIIADFGSQDILTTGDIGTNIANPKADLHIVGISTLGEAMICPNEPSSGDDSQLTLGEDDNATFGMQLRYDGGTNELEIRGVNNGTETVHIAVERDSGDTAIGPSGQVARLTVDGTDDVTQPVTRIYAAGQKALYATSNDDDEETLDVRNNALFGTAIYAEGGDEGIFGRATTTLGIGVHGLAQTGLGGYGVRGEATHVVGYGVYSDGDFGGTGGKYFVQPHPLDASKEIRFVCLEGNESGTYFRGSTQLVGGVATIDVPEEFRLVSEAQGLTVQALPVGAPAALWVESKDLDRIIVRGNVDVSFDYFVNGIRRGWADHEPIRQNFAFVPEVRGVPYGTQYPEAYRQILVDNGILNPDFTPNEVTAAAQGWTLRAGTESGQKPPPIRLQEDASSCQRPPGAE